MRFESVRAYAFGPFRNETLELASGMNVVYGPNEAGKSSWHAALYAGLCGMRRARGRASKDDAEFAELHKPWGNDTSWDVGAVIKLDDSRRVELRHDLAGGVDSSARDVDLAGRDYSNEIMFEGAPDGARWLGLDRRTFVMTACIRHADILGLLDSPSELQDELQRAADTTDRDGTAAEALARLRDFRAESVGSTRAPTKPLRVTEEQVLRAERQLEQAQDEHEEYLTRWMNVDELDQRARDAEKRLGVARATLAAAAASEAVLRLRRARELHAHFPRGAPRRPSQNDNLVRQVASAITTWNQRPNVHAPAGETIPVLEARLTETNLHLAVNAERAAREVEKRLWRARDLNARLPHGRPRRPSEDDQLVRRIASALTAWESRPDVHVAAGPTVAELKQDLACVGAQLGEEAGASGTHEARDASGGLFATLFRAIRAVFAALFRLFGGGRRDPSMQPEKRQALEERRALIRERIAAREDAERQRKENMQQVRHAADAVQEAVAAVRLTASSPDAAAALLLEWQERRTEGLIEIDNQMKDWEALQQILGEGTLNELAKKVATARGEAVSVAARTDAEALATALEGPGVVASREAKSEQRRMALLRAIDERRRQESEHAGAIARVTAAGKAVAEAARLAGIDGEDPDQQVAALRSWQDDRNAELHKADREVEKWEKLQRILGQDSLDDLTREVERLRFDARELSNDVGFEDMAKLVNPPTDAEFRNAERDERGSRTAFDRAQSELEAFGRGIMDVAGEEEALVAVRREYDRVRSLDHTLDLTIRFLQEAEDRVHRTVAPILAETVREWLPRVTGGRYADCRIDPEKLAVEVATANGRWQRAELLSHGTAEQVYLLLRLALARHLASKICPLILDDAVAASDRQRKHDMLETLLAVSESTQVILFTHEDDVRVWARGRLVGGLHKLTELNGARTLA